ncbi:MAG: type II toxin-antitoxin system ParD family antitoxin [Flavobacteriales bacterium]|nr:MAG: type II toxin-antitoxin system ParD family antitoxin [Flavobacteriales bacterium]
MNYFLISSVNHFDNFVRSQVSEGRYKNVSEVVRAGLRLLKDEESKVVTLIKGIKKALNSPRVENFDFDNHLLELKSKRNND